MARTRRGRAETVCEAQYDEFPTFFKYGRAEARFPRARPSSARQSILLITEMIFDPLIISIALKTMKRHQFEIHQNQNKIKIFEIFKQFENFQILSDTIFLAFVNCYNSNQVIKKHLRDQENRLARTRRPRSRVRANIFEA